VLVSAIMPTRSRPALSRTALECWKAQTWAEKELVILDDADDPSFRVPPVEAGVRYYKGPRLSVGAKREWLCANALGEVIIHFDSDDWSHPDRIAQQVELLSDKPMSGYHCLFFWDMRNSVGYRWKAGAGFACGTSMCYTREFWKRQRFKDVKFAEDNLMVYAAQKAGGVSTLDGRQMCVARAHDGSTSSARRLGRNGWPRVANAEFPPLFFAALRAEAARAR